MASASSTFQTPQSGPLTTRTDEDLAPGDIAVGVIIGRASEYFDFFVFGIASVLVFPKVFFPFADALTGTQYGIARTIFFRRISRGGTGFLEFPAYLGFSLEAGNVWQTRDDVDFGDLETAGSIFLGADSPFGPIYLAAGLASGGETAFYLYLGKTF